jgi:predicted amidophosphoribosyltransferase
MGTIVGGIGVLMIVGAFRGKKRSEPITVCPHCETALPLAEARDGMCPRCGTPMEPLEGFYARHPELKKQA